MFFTNRHIDYSNLFFLLLQYKLPMVPMFKNNQMEILEMRKIKNTLSEKIHMFKINCNVNKFIGSSQPSEYTMEEQMGDQNLKKLSKLNQREGKNIEENKQMIDNLLNNSQQSKFTYLDSQKEGMNKIREKTYFKILVNFFPNLMKTINI